MILLIKITMFAIDSRPAYFLGDSESYLATATINWIPPGRSFLYGLLIRLVANHAHSLQRLVAFQVLLSTVTAWLLCVALLKIFRVRFWIAALFSALCAVEPLQLLMERYVMTETCANFIFAVYLILLLLYVNESQLRYLIAGQALGVLLIGIRVSFLPLVLVSSISIPLLSRPAIAFISALRDRATARNFAFWKNLQPPAAALLISLIVSQGLIVSYEHLYGRLEHREPALLYENGAFLIADFAPLVEREDFPRDAPVNSILSNLTIDRHDFGMRPAQHFSPGGLVWSIGRTVTDPRKQNDVAAATAIHAVFRQPLGALKLAWKTFMLYFDPVTLRDTLKIDEGVGQEFTANGKDWLQSVYNVKDPREFEPSITKSWHLAAMPWYWVILVSLCASPLLWFVCEHRDRASITVSVVYALIFLVGASLTVDRPTPRFLTSDAWLVLLMFGFITNRLIPSKKLGVEQRLFAPA
jgi:hypothetical protein